MRRERRKGGGVGEVIGVRRGREREEGQKEGGEGVSEKEEREEREGRVKEIENGEPCTSIIYTPQLDQTLTSMSVLS